MSTSNAINVQLGEGDGMEVVPSNVEQKEDFVPKSDTLQLSTVTMISDSQMIAMFRETGNILSTGNPPIASKSVNLFYATEEGRRMGSGMREERGHSKARNNSFREPRSFELFEKIVVPEGTVPKLTVVSLGTNDFRSVVLTDCKTAIDGETAVNELKGIAKTYGEKLEALSSEILKHNNEHMLAVVLLGPSNPELIKHDDYCSEYLLEGPHVFNATLTGMFSLHDNITCLLPIPDRNWRKESVFNGVNSFHWRGSLGLLSLARCCSEIISLRFELPLEKDEFTDILIDRVKNCFQKKSDKKSNVSKVNSFDPAVADLGRQLGASLNSDNDPYLFQLDGNQTFNFRDVEKLQESPNMAKRICRYSVLGAYFKNGTSCKYSKCTSFHYPSTTPRDILISCKLDTTCKGYSISPECVVDPCPFMHTHGPRYLKAPFHGYQAIVSAAKVDEYFAKIKANKAERERELKYKREIELQKVEVDDRRKDLNDELTRLDRFSQELNGSLQNRISSLGELQEIANRLSNESQIIRQSGEYSGPGQLEIRQALGPRFRGRGGSNRNARGVIKRYTKTFKY